MSLSIIILEIFEYQHCNSPAAANDQQQQRHKLKAQDDFIYVCIRNSVQISNNFNKILWPASLKHELSHKALQQESRSLRQMLKYCVSNIMNMSQIQIMSLSILIVKM